MYLRCCRALIALRFTLATLGQFEDGNFPEDRDFIWDDKGIRPKTGPQRPKAVPPKRRGAPRMVSHRSVFGDDDPPALEAESDDDDDEPQFELYPTHVLRETKTAVQTVSFSPDGRWLAVGTGDRGVLIYEMRNPHERKKDREPKLKTALLHNRPYPISALEFSRDGRWLGTASIDGKARLYAMDVNDLPPWEKAHPDRTDLQTAPALAYTLKENKGSVQTISFSQDGRWFATGGSFDNFTRFYDLKSGFDCSEHDPHPNATYRISEAKHSVVAVNFASSGNWLGVMDVVGHIRGYMTPTDEITRQKFLLEDGLDGPRGAPGILAWTHNGKFLATGIGDNSVRFYRMHPDEGPRLEASLFDADAFITSVAFSSDDYWLAVGSADGCVRLYRCKDDEVKTSALVPAFGAALVEEEQEVYYLPKQIWTLEGNYTVMFDMGDGTWQADSRELPRKWHSLSYRKSMKINDKAGDWLRIMYGETVRAKSMGRNWVACYIKKVDMPYYKAMKAKKDARKGKLEAEDQGNEPKKVIPQLAATLNHTTAAEFGIWAVAFNPDDRWLVTACADGRARLYAMPERRGAKPRPLAWPKERESSPEMVPYKGGPRPGYPIYGWYHMLTDATGRIAAVVIASMSLSLYVWLKESQGFREESQAHACASRAALLSVQT